MVRHLNERSPGAMSLTPVPLHLLPSVPSVPCLSAALQPGPVRSSVYSVQAKRKGPGSRKGVALVARRRRPGRGASPVAQPSSHQASSVLPREHQHGAAQLRRLHALLSILQRGGACGGMGGGVSSEGACLAGLL